MIFVDAGHGGNNAGCQANGLVEKDLTLATALTMRSLAKTLGFPLALSRERDVTMPLSQRGTHAADCGATQVLSLHFDANSDPMVGKLTCYSRRDDQASAALASHVARVAPPILRARANVIHVERDDWTRRAYNVVTAFDRPCLLVEAAFLTNRSHAEWIGQNDGCSTLAISLLVALIQNQTNYNMLGTCLKKSTVKIILY